MQNDIHLLLGSNRGDRLTLLHHAVESIELQIGTIVNFSSVYETQPWGFHDDIPFLNQVLCVRTGLNPFQVLEKILQIETDLGRTRKSKNYSSRTIDIDILFFENQTVDNAQLVIPHPRMHLRRFTLKPLAEISGTLVHPVLGKTISELLDSCEDQSKVCIYNPTLVSENQLNL